jgi:hypothetical protein
VVDANARPLVVTGHRVAMAIDFNEQASDGIHKIHFDNDAGQFEGVVDFPYEEIDRALGFEPEPDSAVTWADMSAAFCLVIEFILGGETLTLAGARAAALAVYLDPVHNSKFGSNLAEIAREANCSRAALSKSLLNFRDAVGVHISAGKPHGSRSTYQEAQRRCIEAGVHSSTTRKDLRSKKASKA